ncbi:unnamed protein product [Rhizoctonia solani]|uniref:Uncharacterized protein n=1 Tax=Rhizoctonia solani TaxID=456999 RepID=A0A8H3DIB2_9AGAM|nr:unnamed protein product [Rhizoctonia solani]
MYAFFRNVFAVLAIAILIFRTITALQKAQNEISTHITSAACDRRPVPDNHNVNLVLEHNPASYFGDDGPPNITVKISYRELSASKELEYPRTLDTFVCPNANQMSVSSDIFNPQVGVPFSRIYIEISRSNNTLDLRRDMPSVWLSNGLEQPANLSSPQAHPVRVYMPAWVLRPGFHIDTEAKLITKRLIKSSILKDVILNSKPAYTSISLYPIAESGLFRHSNVSIATAEIRVTFRPGFMYFGTRADLRSLDSPSAQLEACDYLDDYRSGTILDVIGSVGGLLTVLQGMHILLFGRPLLWGLAGTKLITPFGILGMCSSRRFKDRLKEQYHRRSTEENPDKIHIVSFLRDFVVDFGPADFNPACPPSRQPSLSSTSMVGKEGDVDSVQT